MSWQPTATLATLKKRAEIIQHIRDFFAARYILEVDTPLLTSATVTDPHVTGIPALFKENGGNSTQQMYLQTSPEYAMKRLLAAGSGPIYQMCKAFRQGDLGTFHLPEFLMLEWYRPGFDHQQLMNEVDELLQLILKTPTAERISYAAAFEKYAGINPHLATVSELEACAKHHAIHFVTSEPSSQDKNNWLELLLTHVVEPQIGQLCPVLLFDFPITQAALAKIRMEEQPPVASRFEVYFKGIELANGFHELQNSADQRQRFENDLKYRKKNNLPDVAIDEKFLAALDAGLPDCSGVALGVDRLVMLALGCQTLAGAVSFSFDRLKK
ncbi:MAG: elongation factor P--(R)-beta-lysine ligase [Gammaproteobacteria bacterium]